MIAWFRLSQGSFAAFFTLRIAGGRVLVRFCNISGAQNLSGFPPHLPAHWGLGEQKFQVPRLHFCAWVYRADGTGAVDGGRLKGLTYPGPKKFFENRRGGPMWPHAGRSGTGPYERTKQLLYPP